MDEDYICNNKIGYIFLCCNSVKDIKLIMFTKHGVEGNGT